MKKLAFKLIMVTMIFAACNTSKKTISNAAPLTSSKGVSYVVDIKPIIEKNCTNCHNTNEKAGYNFLIIESVKRAATSGELLGTIKHLDGFDEMPKKAEKLEQASIDKIESWVNSGMNE